ncbi:hypothetical protein EON67_02205 [archaeon]|nr:MAG: hypothetical protein EON67_02205 [archaeon]
MHSIQLESSHHPPSCTTTRATTHAGHTPRATHAHVQVAEVVASLKGLSVQDVTRAAHANTVALFFSRAAATASTHGDDRGL